MSDPVEIESEMALLDNFAAHALTGLLDIPEYQRDSGALTRRAYLIASSMMAERERYLKAYSK
jgi:hypothetical protein